MLSREIQEQKNPKCAIRAEFMAQAGRAHEFEALWLVMRGILATTSGFHDEVLLNSLGYPGKYVAIVKWADREVFSAFYRSPALLETARSGDGFYKVHRPEEAYEVVLTVGQSPTRAGFWWQLVEWDIKTGAAAAFEASRRHLFELRQRHGGIFMSQLFRFLGNSTRYLVLQAYENRDVERAGRTIPEIQQFFKAHPATEYVSHGPVGEYYTAIQLAQPGT